jgi:hypothetical protein
VVADDGVCWSFADAKHGKCGLLIAVSWVKETAAHFGGLSVGCNWVLRWVGGAGISSVEKSIMHKDALRWDESQFILGKPSWFL